MQVVFTDDYKEMLEVEKLLVKKFDLKWSILNPGRLLLKEKFKDDKALKDKGGVCILIKNQTLTWSYGMIFKRGAEKSADTELIEAKEIISNPANLKESTVS